MGHAQRGKRSLTLLACAAVLSAPATTAAAAAPEPLAPAVGSVSPGTDGPSTSGDAPGGHSRTRPATPPPLPSLSTPMPPSAPRLPDTPPSSLPASVSSPGTSPAELGSEPADKPPGTGTARETEHEGPDQDAASPHPVRQDAGHPSPRPQHSREARSPGDPGRSVGPVTESGGPGLPGDPGRHRAHESGDSAASGENGRAESHPEKSGKPRPGRGPSGKPLHEKSAGRAAGERDLGLRDSPDAEPSGRDGDARTPSGEIVPVLPLGAGMTSIGLGLAFIGFRLRRR